MVLNEKEFFEALKRIPGVRVEGDKVIGIRLKTEEGRRIYQENVRDIWRLICTACGDDRSCSSNCLLRKNRLANHIAASLPPSVRLRIPWPK